MSQYRKFMIEDEFARNMFIWSNMNFCMSEVKLEGVNDNVQKVQDRVLLGQKCVHQVKNGQQNGICDIRRNQQIYIKSSRSSTLWSEIRSLGQIWTTVWHM